MCVWGESVSKLLHPCVTGTGKCWIVGRCLLMGLSRSAGSTLHTVPVSVSACVCVEWGRCQDRRVSLGMGATTLQEPGGGLLKEETPRESFWLNWFYYSTLSSRLSVSLGGSPPSSLQNPSCLITNLFCAHFLFKGPAFIIMCPSVLCNRIQAKNNKPEMINIKLQGHLKI